MFHILKAQDTCALTAILLTCNLEDPGSSASVSYLLTGISPAMATFRSRSSLLLQNGLVRTAPVEWLGEPFLFHRDPLSATRDYTSSDVAI